MLTGNSLQIAWGLDQQDRWDFFKKITILNATKLYLKSKPSYQEFYQYIASKRHEIALALQQDNNIGVIRKESAMWTPIVDEGRYQSFHSYLVSQYKKLKVEVDENTSVTRPGFHQEQQVKTIVSSSHFEIKDKQKALAAIYYFECIDVNGNKKEILEVWNADLRRVATVIDKELASLYEKLKNANDKKEIISLTQSIAWYESIAGRCIRGSAAIVEIMTAALLNSANLEFQLKGNATLDLEAFFSGSLENFGREVEISDPQHAFNHEFEERIKSLTERLTDFVNDKEKYLGMILSFFSGGDSEDATSAAKKMIQLCLANFNVRFTEKEIKAMQTDKDLSAIIQEFQKNKTLPANFYVKEERISSVNQIKPTSNFL